MGTITVSEMATMQILITSSLMILLVSALPQLPTPAHPNPAHTSPLNPGLSAHPNAAHTSPLNPGLSAHPNAAHTSPLDPSLSAHPNAAHTVISADCVRFSGAFPCAPGDSACQADYRSSGCGKERERENIILIILLCNFVSISFCIRHYWSRSAN